MKNAIHRALAPALALVALAALPQTTFAGAPPVASADARTTGEARKRFEEGKTAYKRGDYEGARLAFQQAFAILHSTDVLMNLALSEHAGGHYVDALRHLRQYQADPRADPKLLEQITELIAETYRTTGHVLVEAPAAAQVRVDNDWLAGPMPEEVDLAPGTHIVIASLGDDEKREQITAKPGEVVRVRFAFGERETAPIAPAAQPPVPSPVTLAAPPPSSPPHDAAPPSHAARNIATLGFGIAAVAAIGAGAAFQVEANRHEDIVNGYRTSGGAGACINPTPDCDARAHALDVQRFDAHVASGLFIAGGVLATGAVLSWVTLRPRERVEGMLLAPSAGPGYAGIQLRSLF